MQLEEMSLQERHELAVVVTLACIRRLEAIIERSGPRDDAQERRLDLLARKAVDRAELLEVHRRKLQSKGPSQMPRKDVARVLSRHFPSFEWTLGEGTLDPEAGTYLAEVLEEECEAFYRSLAVGLEESESRSLFRSLGRPDPSLLDFVRNMVV
jgi:hypothetical protein